MDYKRNGILVITGTISWRGKNDEVDSSLLLQNLIKCWGVNFSHHSMTVFTSQLITIQDCEKFGKIYKFWK